MSSRQSFDDVRLEHALRDLAPRLAFPAERDLSARVIARIATEQPTRVPARRQPWSWRALAFGTAVLVVIASLSLALSPAVREAVADFLGIGGVKIKVGHGPTPTTPPGENLFLGVETTLDDAQDRVDFPILVPTTPGLEAPDRVYVSGFPPGGRVSLAYRPSEGVPETNETGIGLLIMEFQGSFEGDWLKKGAVQQQVQPTVVNGAPAFWVRGPHTLFYLDAEGKQRSDTRRLSGSALIWMSGDTTLRIESALDLEETLRIAESMR